MSSNLIVTRMDGPDASDASTENPSWSEIESAIRSLDGKRRTLLILGVGDPTPHMGIGGGGDGKYIVYVTPDNLTFDTLIHPDAPPGKCLLVAGGQLGDYENRICVTLSETLAAANTYATTGGLESSLVWERTPAKKQGQFAPK